MVWKESICHVFKSLVHHCENFCQWENAVVHVKSCEPQGLVLTDYPFESGILWSLLCFCLGRGGGCKWLNAVLNLDFYIATIVLFSGMVGMGRFLNCHFPLWTNTLTTCFHTNYISCFLGSSDDMAANLHHSRVTHVSGSWDSPPPIASTLLEKTWKQIWCDQNHKI